jgi:hypothetical protein
VTAYTANKSDTQAQKVNMEARLKSQAVSSTFKSSAGEASLLGMLGSKGSASPLLCDERQLVGTGRSGRGVMVNSRLRVQFSLQGTEKKEQNT